MKCPIRWSLPAEPGSRHLRRASQRNRHMRRAGRIIELSANFPVPYCCDSICYALSYNWRRPWTSRGGLCAPARFHQSYCWLFGDLATSGARAAADGRASAECTARRLDIPRRFGRQSDRVGGTLWGAPRIKLGIDIGWCRLAFIQVNMRSPCRSMICLAFEIAKATASSLL